MKSKKELMLFAAEIRIGIVKCIRKRGFGHIGGSLSIADTLSVLYGDVLRNIDASNPANPDRDFVVCSKGHAGPAFYSTLALQGFFPPEWLLTLNNYDTRLPSHCDRQLTPGVDATCGSLGQGLSIAAGMAHGAKLQSKDNRAFCIVGDGELAEGQIWEAAQYAAAKKLNNLICFIDWNKKQVDGKCEDVLAIGNIEEKFKAFGWYAGTVDGSDVLEIRNAVLEGIEKSNNRPVAIVLDTIKGSGVPFFEEMEYNHHVKCDDSIMEQAEAYLQNQISEIAVETEE